MPIANCIFSPKIAVNGNEPTVLVEKWGQYSEVDISEMTVTIVRAENQLGKGYDAICTLSVPSLWPPKSVSLLQIGLAKAIAEHFRLQPSDVLVMTSIIESGYVVEGGKEICW